MGVPDDPLSKAFGLFQSAIDDLIGLHRKVGESPSVLAVDTRDRATWLLSGRLLQLVIAYKVLLEKRFGSEIAPMERALLELEMLLIAVRVDDSPVRVDDPLWKRWLSGGWIKPSATWKALKEGTSVTGTGPRQEPLDLLLESQAIEEALAEGTLSSDRARELTELLGEVERTQKISEELGAVALTASVNLADAAKVLHFILSETAHHKKEGIESDLVDGSFIYGPRETSRYSLALYTALSEVALGIGDLIDPVDLGKVKATLEEACQLLTAES